MIEEVIESPAFWILGGGGVLAELIGWIASKKFIGDALPLWQLGILMVGTLIAGAYFALKE